MTTTPAAPHWGLICGAWGDMVCSLPYLKENGLRKVFFFGESKGVTEFMEAQDFIDRAVWLEPKVAGMNRADFQHITALIWQRSAQSGEVMSSLMGLYNTGVSLSELENCVTNSETTHYALKPPSGLRNTADAESWADTFLQEHSVNEPFVLLCPVSLQSTSLGKHWPHWEEFLDWITGHTGVRFILCGTDNIPFPSISKPNVLNALRVTPTAAHMYALASRASLTISTINGLSHWCNAANLRSLVVANLESSEGCSYWPRIQQADNLHGLVFQDTLETAKLTAARLVDLGNGAPREVPPRDWWREWARQDIRRAYQTCPRMPRADHISDFGQSADMYPIYQRLGATLKPRRMLEIGSRLGHSLIALASDNPDLQSIDWIDNETYVANSNSHCQENIEHFFLRYRPQRELPALRHWQALSELPLENQISGSWDTIYIDGEHTYEAKIRDMNWALAMKPRAILVDDYYHMPCNREAIRDFSADAGVPFWEVHTLRGLAIFDLTPDASVSQALLASGLGLQRAALATPKQRPYAAVACVWRHTDLVSFFLRHYTRLGYQKFFFVIYGGKSSSTWAECERYGAAYDLTLVEEFIPNPTGRTDAAAMVRVAVQNIPSGEWWSPLDLDEFLEFSMPISEIFRTAGTANAVAGGLLDHLSPDGALCSISQDRPLSQQFPLGCFLTRDIIRSTHRKLLLVRDIKRLGGGHHASPEERPHKSATGWSHHFKWSESVSDRAATHLFNHADHKERSSVVYQRYFDLNVGKSRIDLSQEGLNPWWIAERPLFEKGSGGITV